MAILNGTHKADTITGTAQNDSIFGDNGNDIINGGAGDDHIDGGNGSDMISGGAGDDVIDGGNGQDTLVLTGKRSDYRVLEGQNGSVVVRDLRSGSPDGQDRLFSIERVQFSDGTFKLVDLIQANVAPVAHHDALTLSETAGKTEVTPVLLANDSDADGDSFVVSAVQAVSAQGAIVTLGPDGKVSYDAGSIFAYLDNGQTATDSFTYTITDGNGHTSTATATVTITGVTPQVEMPEWDAFFYVAEDGIQDEMWGSIVESFSFDIVGIDASHALGTVVFDMEAGILSFTADHPSSDALNYDQHQETWFTVFGPEGQKKVIGLWIEGVNDDIIAVDDHVSIGEGQTSGNLWSTIVSNEIDPDGSPNTHRILSVGTSGTQGQVSFDASSRTLTYSAAGIDLAPGETLVDSFTYTVDDSFGATDTATVYVTVTGGPSGGASISMTGGESIMSAFVGGAGGSHLDDSGFAGFPSMQALQEMLVADAVIA
ncbi:MAG TPA: Ig-like domain-containing protein [Allosphingosinicella sp.]|nr:Ig-like domain-containing protein [Allosphingosinicella sp.]